MITQFDDFCLWIYCLVDDACQQLAIYFHRPGMRPLCSDSEVIAMVLIIECRPPSSLFPPPHPQLPRPPSIASAPEVARAPFARAVGCAIMPSIAPLRGARQWAILMADFTLTRNPVQRKQEASSHVG